MVVARSEAGRDRTGTGSGLKQFCLIPALGQLMQLLLSPRGGMEVWEGATLIYPVSPGVQMVPISWCEMQCPRTHTKEFRKVARVQPQFLQT